MVNNKEEALRMHPDDTVIILTNDSSNHRSLSQPVHFLTLTFPDNPEQFALAFSGEKEAALFRSANVKKDKLYYKRVQLKELFPVLMTNKLHFLIDPLGEELTILTPMEMCEYCMKHQTAIFKGDLHEMPYMNFRAAWAKARGGEVREKLMQDVMRLDCFWVASFSFAPVSPFVSRIGKLDARPHIMIFSDQNEAMKFCQHINPSLPEKKTVPIQVSAKQLLQMVEDNWDAGIRMFYLNDGAEGIAMSYHEMKKAMAS